MTAIFDHPYTTTLGFHGGCVDEGMYENDWKQNLGNVLSWIPIIGAIIGAIRLYAGYQFLQKEKKIKGHEEEDLTMYKATMIRGAVEIATLGCIGPIMLLVDTFFSIGRMCTQEQ